MVTSKRWPLRWLEALARSDRVPVLRHGAFVLACVTAFVLRRELRVGNIFLFILGAAACLNLTLFLLSRRPRLGSWCLRGSALLGAAAWLSLVRVTGGSSSPFLVGLSLEVVFSVLTLPPAGILLLAGASAAALVGMELFLDAQGNPWLVGVQSAVLGGMGVVAACAAWHWGRERDDMAGRHAALRQRLEALEIEIEEARTVGRVGEHVARLAHGLKNAVHSLRGFTALIEPRITGAIEYRQSVLEGLRAAIDRLEALAHDTLAPGATSVVRPVETVRATELRRVVEEECREIEVGFPEVLFRRSLDAADVPVSISCEAFREIVQALLRNAAEASGGVGEITLASRFDGDRYRLEIRDRGAGPPAHAVRGDFPPGITTKPGGSGYGLFLASRLLAARGGTLVASPGPDGGAVFSVSLSAQTGIS